MLDNFYDILKYDNSLDNAIQIIYIYTVFVDYAKINMRFLKLYIFQTMFLKNVNTLRGLANTFYTLKIGFHWYQMT